MITEYRCRGVGLLGIAVESSLHRLSVVLLAPIRTPVMMSQPISANAS
jgi:hypothetical protein